MVTRAKKARSGFRGGQGRVPRRPMPRAGVVATMRVRRGRGRGGGMGVMVVVVVGGRGWSFRMGLDGRKKEVLSMKIVEIMNSSM